MNFTVDISPMAGSTFRLAPSISTGPSSGGSSMRGSNHSDQYQRLLSNRILRCIERIVLTGGALDTEALVLQTGKWVWKLTVALTVLDAGGNILDACVLAAMAALKHYRKPQVDLSEGGDGSSSTANSNNNNNNSNSNNASTATATTPSLPTMIPSIVKEATPLPLHHTPLSISFGLIPADDAVNSTSSSSVVAALIDPTDREELVQSGSLTIAMNVHSEICLLDYGGGCELTPNKLRECWRVADSAIKKLCKMLEASLATADEQAQKDRLQRLQMNQSNNTLPGIGGLPPLPPASNIPFLQQTEHADDAMEIDGGVDEAQVQQVHTEAEEAYRQNALDYASGHAPVAVREISNADRNKSNSSSSAAGKQAGSLLAAMLKSIGRAPSAGSTSGGGNAAAAGAAPKAIAKVEEQPKDMTNTRDTTHKKTSVPKSKTPIAMDIDKNDNDDEEEDEAPMMLTTEFGSIQKEENSNEAMTKEEMEVVEAEADIEDLSMAIKSKKGKKKKKSKKK
jgi:exosome complex component RRP45